MKFFNLTLIFALFVSAANAQISTFPYTQGFETPFTTVGSNVVFTPNWQGNAVADSNRICRDLLRPRTGVAALACLPTSTVRDTIIVSINLAGKQEAAVSFFAASDSARSAVGGTRAAVAFMETSTDGGLTYTGRTQIGDSTSFPRRPTAYRPFSYTFSSSTDNKAAVKLRLIVGRGVGAGTTARFLMDDFVLTANNLTSTEASKAALLSFGISPNPAQRTAINVTTATQSKGVISLYNAFGQLMQQQVVPLGDNTTVVPTDALPSGCYFVSIRTENGSFGTQKLIIE